MNYFRAEVMELCQREGLHQIDLLGGSGERVTADAEKWITLIKQYSEPTELTAEMLNTLIEKIVVHEAVKDSDGTGTQEIEYFTDS